MGSLDQIARQRAQGRQPAPAAGGTLDQIASHRSGGGTGLPDTVAGTDGIPKVTAPPAAHHGGGGLLGGLKKAAHYVAQKAELAATDAKNIPGGLVEQAKIGLPIEAALVNMQLPSKKQLDAFLAEEKAQVVSTRETIRHPGRDPFQTGLLAVGALSGVGSVAGRAAAGAKAASEGATAADVAKALVKKPEVKPRLIRVGNEQVPLQPSKNVTVRAGQGVYDKLLQRGLDKNPEGRVAAHATKRVGGSIAETARYRARLRDVPATLLDQSAKKLAGKTPRSIGSRVHQAALELTSVNTAPEDAAAYHRGQAEKGVNPARNRTVAALYQKVADNQLLTKNAAGDVIVNAEKHPKLAQTDIHLARVQGQGDAVLAKYGVRLPEELQAAVDAPGRYRAGATYEKPTPGKLGKTTPGLKNAQKRAVSLEGRVARSQAGKFRTVEEAQARLAVLDREHNVALDKIAGRMFGHIDAGEVAYRNAQNARADRQASGLTRNGRASGSTGYKSTRRVTVTNQMRGEAERAVARIIEKNPDHPIAAQWKTRSDEIASLQAALKPDIFEKINRRELGHVGEPTDPQRHAQLEGALAVAQRDLSTAEKTAASRVQPTGIVGGDLARPGRGHVSYAGTEPKAPKSAVAASSGPLVGEARSPITSHANQGINIGLGNVPKNITGQAARKYHQIMRFVNTSELRNQSIRTGSNVRRTSRDVLARVPGEDHAKIPAAVDEILGRKNVTTDDIQGLSAALQAYKEDLVPGLKSKFAEDRGQGIGTPAPEGHVWVDRNVLGDLGRSGPGPRGRISRSFDNINSAVTAATVYFKIGHIGTRLLTNAATNIIQGSAMPTEIAQSVKLFHALNDEDRLRALAASGQHSFSAMPHEGTSWVSKVAGKGAQFWARRADARFRFNSIAYEARKAGFDTPEKFRTMLNQMENPEGLNAAQTAKIDWVAKRSNREGIAYDRLNDFERRYLARALWFYPWLRGTVNFAGNTILEHPYKSVVLGRLGEQGRQQQQQDLGDLPSYERGLFKLRGGQLPTVADFSTFSPFATPADIADVASVGQASSFLNPVMGSAVQLGTRQNQFGQHSNSPLLDALAQLVSPAPESQIVTGFLNRKKPQGAHMFPASPELYGTLSPLTRALVGPGMPRKFNPSAGHKAAARERSGR